MAQNVRECACCGCEPDIQIRLPDYGFVGVVIKCPNCGLEMRNADCHEHISSEKCMATPITEKSLSKCLFDAIRKWNRRSDRANGFIDDLGIEPDAETWKKNHHWEEENDG